MGLKAAQFHHVALVSGDASRTSAFYGDLLGLAPAAGGPDRLLFGDLPGGLLDFEVRSGAERGRWGVGGVHHVALGVGTEAAQLKWKRRLQDAGVAVSGPYNRGWFHSIYFTDPDGQVLEIATAGPGYATDEAGDALGGRLVMPRAEQMRGGRDEAAIAALTHPEPVATITAEMILDGIHHVTGLTADAEGMHDLLTGVLGLSLVKRTVNQDDGKTPHLFWASYDPPTVAPHSSYTLFDWRASTYRARAGVGQTRHIAFMAGGDELEGWREALGERGVRASPVLEDGFFRMITFAAPDGQALAITSGGAADAALKPRR